MMLSLVLVVGLMIPPAIADHDPNNDGDTDGDGFLDFEDDCPHTFDEVFGCPGGIATDTDGDGIPDSADDCPEGGATGTEDFVSSDPASWDGCPEEGSEPDDDGDGVPDVDDLCADTPLEAPVNAVGCPDTDGDGVFDNEDACLNEFGTEENGCPPDPDRKKSCDALEKENKAEQKGKAQGKDNAKANNNC